MSYKIISLQFILFFAFCSPVIRAQYITADQYSNSRFLENVVNSVLVHNNFHRIEVSEKGIGVIELEGSVPNYYDKIYLQDIVLKIPGVRKVINDVIVDSPSLPDEVIAENIRNGVAYVLSNVSEDVDVNVKNGVVFLEGDVSDPGEKNTIHKIASFHEGVRGVVNKIKTRPASGILMDNYLKNYLKELIKQRYPDEKEIEVSVKDGLVILEGKVSSEKIKEEIPGNISEMEGVKNISNQLDVKSSNEEDQDNR